MVTRCACKQKYVHHPSIGAYNSRRTITIRKAAERCQEYYVGPWCLHELQGVVEIMSREPGMLKRHDGYIAEADRRKYRNDAEMIVRTRFGDLHRSGVFTCADVEGCGVCTRAEKRAEEKIKKQMREHLHTSTTPPLPPPNRQLEIFS